MRKEDGLVSSVMFNNWKNGVLVDKESKYKTLAGLVLGAELMFALSGAYLFSHSFVRKIPIPSIILISFLSSSFHS